MGLQGRQLTMQVDQHPQARDLENGGWLDGAIKISGALGVDHDLQPGDALTVTIANADGEVVASAEATIETIGFPPIKVNKKVVGTTRMHKAKIELVTS